MKIYNFLNAFMKVEGISQSELSEKSNIPYSTLNRFLVGKSEIRTKAFISILDCLGIRLEEIVSSKIANSLNEDSLDGKDSMFTVFSELPRLKKKLVIDTLVSSVSKSKREKIKPHIENLKKMT